jgi:hypothetical protein
MGWAAQHGVGRVQLARGGRVGLTQRWWSVVGRWWGTIDRGGQGEAGVGWA